MYMYIHKKNNVYAYIYIYIHIDNTHVYLYIIKYNVYIHAYITHTYIHACMHAYIHTYIHTSIHYDGWSYWCERSEFRGSGEQSGENVCKQYQIGDDNGFWSEGHVPGGNWVTVGFSPLVRIFGGLERKLRCAQNIVFYRFFCLPVSRDFAKNVEVRDFWMLTSQKRCNLYWFLTLQWSKLRAIYVALRPGV